MERMVFYSDKFSAMEYLQKLALETKILCFQQTGKNMIGLNRSEYIRAQTIGKEMKFHISSADGKNQREVKLKLVGLK